MKQVLQSPRSGELELAEVPAPAVAPGQVLVRNHHSVVSPGTEKLALDFARKSMLGKARSRPDLVAQVTRKLRHEGPLPTYRAVRTRLEAPQPLGYSCAGVVEAVGEGVAGFAPGDRVACAGAGYASHAELVCVPENLVAAVPEPLSLEKAAFATVGAIALQGLRVAGPTLGEVGAVVGLGLIGQVAVQCLHANGCRVLGVDLDPERAKRALAQGAAWSATPGSEASAWRDRVAPAGGADFCIVAAASESSAPVRLAAELSRLKGRVVVVGATAMELERRTFYEKELELRMSMSYGPGRYDRRYEEVGLDYPLPYVRWTENRNLQAFLGLAASGAVDPGRLDVESVPFEEALSAYEALARGESRSLAVAFRYAAATRTERTLSLASGATARPAPADGDVGVAFLGAGSYAKSVLLPALRGRDALRRVALVTATGASARRTAERFGFASCGTDPEAVIDDPGVHLVFVATRHDTHAELAERALRAGKAVWLEKPVGLSPQQVDSVVEAARASGALLVVGYNRRFSRHTRAIRSAFEGRRGPVALRYTVAAGPPPRGSWLNDPAVGGGRIVGELCHFVDLALHLVGAPISRVAARALARDPDVDDSTVAMLELADGSVATIEYLAHASSDLPKERFEISGAGRTASCENFRRTRIHGGSGRGRVRTLNQDKGQESAVAEVLAALRSGGPSPIPAEEIRAGALATFAVAEAAHTGGWVEVEP